MAFESVSKLAKRSQYKITQRPIAYSVIGGIHNVGGKICTFRIRIELAEQLGWKLGDCVEVLWDKDAKRCRLVRNNSHGYRLVATAKRNGIASYRVSWTWQDSFGFPNVKIQVPCEIMEFVDEGVELRICEEEASEARFNTFDDSYKDETSIDDGGKGFNHKTVRGVEPPPLTVKEAIQVSDKAELEKLKKRMAKVKEIIGQPRKSRRNGSENNA